MKILVTGATGYIGGRLIPRLLRQGHAVRCMARRPEALAGRPWPGAEIVAGDVLDPSTLAPALAGVEVAYYLVHSMTAGEEGFEERDRKAARNFADAARAAGVKRILYLGGLGDQGAALSPHLKSRQEVGEILRSSGVPVTEFRAAIIVGSGSLSFEMIRALVERLPVMIGPKWVMSRCQPIAIRDVLAYLTAAAVEPRADGRVFEIGGADVLTYRDMMLGYAKVRGLKRRLVSVPVLTPRVSSYWVDLVTPIPAALARPLIEGLRNDVVCGSRDALETFDVRPIGYEEAVRLALERIEEGEVETIWSGSQSSLEAVPAPPPLHPTLPHLEMREGMIMEKRETEVESRPEAVFRVFSGIGGDRGWFYADWVWRLRGFLDRLVGGIGMRRGRRNPDTLRAGDALDFWRVEEVRENRLLRLRAEMKVPGRAWLQFEVVPEAGSEASVLSQTAFFEPKGLAGLLYWVVLYPFHRPIFSGLIREIKRRSEEASP